jgi:hypothetical protein
MKRKISPFSYSKDLGYDPFSERFTFASKLDLDMGYHYIKLDADVDAQTQSTI